VFIPICLSASEDVHDFGFSPFVKIAVLNESE